MDPIVGELHVGGLHRPIGSYGVMMSIAMVVGTAIAARAAYRSRIDVGTSIALMGFAIGGGVAGSWILYLIVEWVRTGSPLPALSRGGGFVFLGGPAGGAGAVILGARVLGVSARRFADLGIAALPAGHALGRIGCFLGGCCYGQPWDGPWAVTYTHPMAPGAYPSVARHPTPLYESGLLLLLAFAFTLIPPERVGNGRRFFAYLACYGVLRFVVEAFRGDAVRGIIGGVISTSQLLGILIFVGGTVGVLVTRPRTS